MSLLDGLVLGRGAEQWSHHVVADKREMPEGSQMAWRPPMAVGASCPVSDASLLSASPRGPGAAGAAAQLWVLGTVSGV